MATIKKLDSGKYEVRYDTLDAQGRRVQRRKRFSRKKEAQQFLTEVTAQVQAGTYVAPVRQTLAQYLEEWLESRRHELSGSSHYTYNKYMSTYIAPHVGHLLLQELRPSHVRELHAILLKRISAKSVTSIHAVLQKALADAELDGLVHTNAASKVKRPSPERREAQFLSSAEIHHLLGELHGNTLYLPVALAALCGLRRGEALGLQWEDVDWDEGVLRVRHTYGVVDTVPVLRRKTKSDKGRRDIAIYGTVVDALKEQVLAQKKSRLALGDKAVHNEFVCTHETGEAIHPGWLQTNWRKVADGLGYSGLRFHDLRHSHAGLLISSQTPIKAVQDRLGHATSQMTLDVYGHIGVDVHQRIAKVVDEAVFGEGV